MKKWWFIYVSLVLFSSCDRYMLTGDDNFAGYDVQSDTVYQNYFSKTEWFEHKKQEMLAVPDDKYEFWFSGDTELEELDPHAYWLMNRMMQMMLEIGTADDGWAWMLAMNESVEMYNARLGRKIGSPELAMAAIGDLIDKYGAGNQPEMNAATHVDMIIAHYKTVLSYQHMFIFIDDHDEKNDADIRLMELHYQEYSRWFDLNNAANGLMFFYSYAAARYSAMPMDVNVTFQSWSEERFNELELEQEIHWSYKSKPYKSPTSSVSVRKFNRLIGFFKSRTYETVYKEYMDFHEGMDDEYFNAKFEESYDFDKIAEMVRLYAVALGEWRMVRKQITMMLPDEEQYSYKQITHKMHTRFYNDLLDLKQLRY